MPKKILIADDDKGFVRLLGVFLQKQGYEIVIAHDGAEALQKMQKMSPDLVLLDIVMPNVNGYAFVLEVKKLKDLAQVPIIVLTYKEQLEDIFKLEGVKEYIVKPFEHKDLLEKIQKHI
ncbi:MAG: response regulator [Candidatus Omnitrophica bacterium]|nr:response regulator [Candidatus Omnitrophota bacterium]